MPVERNFPIIPEIPRGLAANIRTIQQTLYDLQDAGQALASTGAAAFSGTAALAKLTTGGTAGSITFVNGLATAYTAPT